MQSTPQFTDLTLSLANVLDAIMTRADNLQSRKGGQFSYMITIRIRRALKTLRESFAPMIKLLLTKPAVPSRAAILLGHIVRVARTLKPSVLPKGAIDGPSIIKSEKDALLNYFVTVILSSKTELSDQVAVRHMVVIANSRLHCTCSLPTM